MKRTLPASLDQVQGMRAARWFRESTAGQWDNFGPDAQREQQDRAITRYGLADSGLEWSVAASGWKLAWRTPSWEAMIASARAGAFDVLVVGYVSRFLRTIAQDPAKEALVEHRIVDHLKGAVGAVLVDHSGDLDDAPIRHEVCLAAPSGRAPTPARELRPPIGSLPCSPTPCAEAR
jgi:Resolvase, N terminal domain